MSTSRYGAVAQPKSCRHRADCMRLLIRSALHAVAAKRGLIAPLGETSAAKTQRRLCREFRVLRDVSAGAQGWPGPQGGPVSVTVGSVARF